MSSENKPIESVFSAFFFEQLPIHREAVKIISGAWNRKGQNVFSRRIVLWREPEDSPSPKSYSSGNFQIKIKGTPNRGCVWIWEGAADPPVFRFAATTRKLTERQAKVVRRLLANLLEQIQ